MSEILKRIRADLKYAMTTEINIRKNPASGPHLKEMQREVFDTCIDQKTVSRAIISMFPEIRKKPDDATDDDTIKLLKKYINQEKERTIYQLKYLKESDVQGKSASEVKTLMDNTIKELGPSLTSNLIEIAKIYLPKEASEEDIIKWINDNLDLTSFKNKMQAMGPIMKQFKGADGNIVKSILLKL